MRDLMQPLRDQHKQLIPHLENLRKTGDAIDEADLNTLRTALDDDCLFLRDQLIPHFHAEEAVLYPVVARMMGSLEAVAAMKRDHLEVIDMVRDLLNLRDDLASGPLTRTLARDLSRVLYGLYALIQVHFVKEEEVYVPVLERRLTHQAAQDLFRAMQEATQEAKAHAAGPAKLPIS